MKKVNGENIFNNARFEIILKIFHTNPSLENSDFSTLEIVDFRFLYHLSIKLNAPPVTF